MTSETNEAIEPTAFQPVDPEPGPLPVAIPVAEPVSSRRTRAIVNGILGIAFVVLVGGLGFAAGRATAPDAEAAGGAGNGDGILADGFRPGNGNGGFGQLPGAGNVGPGDGGLRLGFGGMSVQGTVKAIDADSITLGLADGRAIEIAIDSDTDYHRKADASASDITTGATVIVGVDVGRGVGANPTAGDVTIVP